MGRQSGRYMQMRNELIRRWPKIYTAFVAARSAERDHRATNGGIPKREVFTGYYLTCLRPDVGREIAAYGLTADLVFDLATDRIDPRQLPQIVRAAAERAFELKYRPVSPDGLQQQYLL